MKTIKILAMAAAVAAVFSCKQPSAHDRLMAEALKDSAVVALKPSQSYVDSVSYLLGVNYGLMFTGNGFFDEMSEVNMDQIKKGMEAAFAAGQPKNPYGVDSTWASKFEVSPYDINKVFNEYLSGRQAYKAKMNEVIGKKFLAENAKNEGVQVTESGLQYILHAEGEGDKVGAQDTVVVNYKGTLIDGTEFDANDEMTFVANQVIKGWTEGLGLMGKGGKATLYIPSELAYGARAPRGSVITANSTLIFEVEVVDVKPYQEPVVVEVTE